MVHEGCDHLLCDARERVVEPCIATYFANREISLGQVHHRILQRSFDDRREVVRQRSVIDAGVGHEARLDDMNGRFDHVERVAIAAAPKILGAREDHERVRVKIFHAVARRAVRSDAVVPAAACSVGEVRAQRLE
jgi:hypothetical protein